jgi:hypothetical protein
VEEDEELILIWAEFEDMPKNPKTLYKEIVELITRIRDLRAYGKNYQEQL